MKLMEMARRMSPLQTNQMRSNSKNPLNCQICCQITCLMTVPMIRKVQDVAEVVDVVAEGEGVATISITTTISTTRTTTTVSTTITTPTTTTTKVATVVALIMLGLRPINSKPSLSSTRSCQLEPPSSLPALACQMARGVSPWAEGSRNRFYRFCVQPSSLEPYSSSR